MSLEGDAPGGQGLATVRTVVRMAGWPRLILLGLLMLVSSLTEGIGLLLLVPITAVIAGEKVPQGMGAWFEPLLGFPVGLLLAAIAMLVTFRALVVYLVLDQQARLSHALTRTIRIKAQDAVLSADWRWLSQQSTAAHAARLVGEAERVGSLGQNLLSAVTSLVTLVMLTTAAFAISWRLTGVAVLSGAVVVVVLVALRGRKNREGERFAAAYGALQQQVTNGLFHFRAARISGAEDALAQQFSVTAREVEQSQLSYHRSVSLAHVLFQAIAAVVLGGLIYVALVGMRLPLGVLVPVLAILVRMVPVAIGLQGYLRRWNFDSPALIGLQRMIQEAGGHREPEDDGGEPPRLRKFLELRGIGLRYAGRERAIFQGFDLIVKAGSIVAICGPSGVGKSSLADMLGGLIEPDSGKVLIDGQRLTSHDRIRWRRRVAYVEQVPYLFDGTIAQNLAWGQPTSNESTLREAVERALAQASAQFVFALPNGLDTRVGEAGRQFSGGERQRLALARALLRKPDLLILDEVTAALDGANEQAITDMVQRLKGECTILILGHRSALLALADQIVDLGEHASN